MPLTPFQRTLARLLAQNRSPDSHLAGGAALHFQPNSIRYSNDLDYFHDSVERVSSAFESDKRLLEQHGFELHIELNQIGYIRATAQQGNDECKVEWAHDSSWRFMPVVAHPELGYLLHPVDLGVNKVLALAGRDEPRDFLDVLTIHSERLALGALCWTAVGKDPGFTPLSLLELIKRRGKYRPEDFRRLRLVRKANLVELKTKWLNALESAAEFVNHCNPEEIGCLYFDCRSETFVAPSPDDHRYANSSIVPHYGRPGGVLPAFIE